MGKKFDEIFESVVGLYNVGGYKPGDYVTFRPNYKQTDTYKYMNSTMQKELDELVTSGLNIKVVQIGDNLSGVTGGNQHKLSTNAVITVAADHGGGRHYGSITVCPLMIDLVGRDQFAPPIPDQFRKKDIVDYKPKVFVADTKHPSRLTDKGDGKNTPTNLKLAGESTRMRRDNENLVDLYEKI